MKATDQELNYCLKFVIAGAVAVVAIPLLFGVCGLSSYFADPGLRAMPDQYGNPVSPTKYILIFSGIIVVCALFIVWLIEKGKRSFDPNADPRGWRYAYHHHFFRPDDRFDNGPGTKKGASWYEGWHHEPPPYYIRAVEKCVDVDPYSVWDDAVVVKSWVEDKGDRAVIHDGIVTIAAMEGANSGNIDKALSNYMMVYINEVSEWRERETVYGFRP